MPSGRARMQSFKQGGTTMAARCLRESGGISGRRDVRSKRNGALKEKGNCGPRETTQRDPSNSNLLTYQENIFRAKALSAHRVVIKDLVEFTKSTIGAAMRVCTCAPR